MIQLLLIIILILMVPFSLLGFLVVFHTAIRGGRSPADQSNRIARIRLFWFSITREELFVGIFPWLKKDEYETVAGVKDEAHENR